MYQHHIQLKTNEPLSGEQALEWYNTIKEYGPDDVVFSYTHNGKDVAMEYGTCEDCEMANTYVVPLKRDLTPSETAFILEAWGHKFNEDFDIEISNSYDAMGMGEFENTIEIDEEVKIQAITDMNKWRHNRWVDQMVSEGWHWGTHYNSKQKTHPALRQWDDLAESHRRSQPIENTDILEWLRKYGII